MLPNRLDRYQATMDREISLEEEMDTLMTRYDGLERIYPYAPFACLDICKFYNDKGVMVHQTPLSFLGNNTLRKWIDLAYVATTETKGIHLAIRSSANQLIDDFARELVMREQTQWDGELPL